MYIKTYTFVIIFITDDFSQKYNILLLDRAATDSEGSMDKI